MYCNTGATTRKHEQWTVSAHVHIYTQKNTSVLEMNDSDVLCMCLFSSGLVDILRQGDKQAQEEKGTNPYVHEIRTCGLKTFQNLTRATINRSFRKARWMVNLWICKENENEVV